MVFFDSLGYEYLFKRNFGYFFRGLTMLDLFTSLSNIIWTSYIRYLNLLHSFAKFQVFFNFVRIIFGFYIIQGSHYCQTFMGTFMGITAIGLLHHSFKRILTIIVGHIIWIYSTIMKSLSWPLSYFQNSNCYQPYYMDIFDYRDIAKSSSLVLQIISGVLLLHGQHHLDIFLLLRHSYIIILAF